MAAFKEESGVETRNGCIHRVGIQRSRFRTIAFHHGLFVPFQFLEYQIRMCLFKRHRLVNDYYLFPLEAVTAGFFAKGGDGSMH